MAKKKPLKYQMRMKVNDYGVIERNLGVSKTGRVQRFVTDEVFTRLIDYIPKQSGTLRSMMQKESDTKIIVTSPYVRVQFFGVTKRGKPFNYDTVTGGAKAGSHWDRRLMQDEGAAIVAKTNRFIRKR